MEYKTCPHVQEMATEVLFKLNENNLVIPYWCDKCEAEFNRAPTEEELFKAKELGIIK